MQTKSLMLLLATHNRHKAREFQEIMSDVDMQLLTLDEFPLVGEITEDADTLEGNAVKKAREVFRITGVPSIADDTGLEVRYLNDEPGVYSARYAGAGATYADNCKKLLSNLRGVPPRRRRARFRSVLAFVPTGAQEFLAEGICNGIILESPRGGNGFGYDPIFLPDGYQQTFAEIDAETKNRISHRGIAFRHMKEILGAHFANSR